MNSESRTASPQSLHWNSALSFPTLHKGQAHVWRCDLDALSPAEYQPLLNADERERAARFHFPLHAARYIAARGVLRRLLSRYLGRKPEEFHFVLNGHGKPELVEKPLRFNVSHSKNRALLAFGFPHDLGVDLEFCRGDYDDVKIARLASRFFCAAESKELDGLSGEARRTAFFRCWTRKEALLKATGDGISGGLAKYQVSLLPGATAQVLTPQDEASGWSLFDLQPEENFAGALAVRARQCEVFCYSFAS